MNATFPIQLAKEAILLEKYPEAIDLLRPVAESGDPEAQFLYGYLHFLNPTLSQAEALELLRAAADRDHPEALYVLATCPTLEPDYAFAAPTTNIGMRQLRRAARLGSIDAKIGLAKIYLERKGSRRYLKKGLRILKNLGTRRTGRSLLPAFYPEVHYRLGLIYLNGIGIKRNIRKAFFSFELAASTYSHFNNNPYTLSAAAARVEVAQKHPETLKESWITRVWEEYEAQKTISIKPDWQNYIYTYCLHTLTYDLTHATFDEFVAFHFEHFIEPIENQWHRRVKVEFEPRLLLQYYLKLLRDPQFLLERYDHDTLEQGLWITRWSDSRLWTLSSIAFDPQVTLDETEKLVRAAYHLFEKLFAVDPLNNLSCFMWWDSPYDIVPNDRRKKRRDDREAKGRLAQASFETMAKVLKLDSLACQEAALHGIGHMRRNKHPASERAEQIILEFIEAHPDLPEKVRDYALAAIEAEWWM